MWFRLSTAVVLVLLVADAATGATITVRKDGTGDYMVIQAALNVAAAGDTIMIGPGQYTEMTTTRLPGWGWDIETCGRVWAPGLTIIGAGSELTIIGPTTYNANLSTFTPQCLVYSSGGGEFSLQDLTVRNCYAGVGVVGTIYMDRCKSDHNETGVFLEAANGGWIKNSQFVCVSPPWYPTGISTHGSGSGLVVEDCEFDSTVYLRTDGFLIVGCTFQGGRGIIETDGSSGGIIRDCEVRNTGISAIHLYTEGDDIRIEDSTLASSNVAISTSAPVSVTVEHSSLTGGATAVIDAYNANSITIHNSDLHRGTGPVILCSRPAAWGAVIYDLTNNYWGTTSATDIQAWIIDSNDDANIAATVLYSPFSGESLPTESTTWGDLKALFR
jgi:hypothetical protein